MLRKLVTALTLSAVWVAWSWHFEPIVVGFGIVAVLLTVVSATRLGVLDAEGEPFEINLRLLGYLPWLAWQVLTSNVTMARIILHPRLPIRPQIIKVPTSQRTTLGQVIHANTITITPGTISLDVRDGVILVHAVDQAFADKDDEGATDRMVSWLEGRVASPRSDEGDT